jgi:membrane protein
VAQQVRGRDRQRRAEGIFRLARRILWQASYNFDKDNGWMMAGHIAYMGLFALFPFLIFLVALAGFLGQGDAANTSVELGLELLPEDVASALKPAIDEVRKAPHAGLMTFGIMATLWASSSGLEALRHALNLAYAVADQPAFWRTRLESLLLTILAAIVVIVVMVLLVVVPLVLDTLQIVFHKQAGAPPPHDFLGGSREALGFLLLLGLLMLLYRVLPSVRLRATEVVPGALLAWALWLAAVWGYSVYLRSVPSFSITYGSLGGIIVTLFFFYISAFLFVFGAEFNSVLRRRHQHREQGRGAAAAPLSRPHRRD